MYNENIKSIYLNSLDSDKRNLIYYFDDIQDVEEAIGKDLSCFTLDEILGYYKSKVTCSRTLLYNINRSFLLYSEWCRNNDLIPDNQNHYTEVTNELLMDCLNQHLLRARIISREDLLKFITDNINRYNYSYGDMFALLACFEGISGVRYCEIRELYPKDFNNGKVFLRATNREFDVSQELITLAEKAADEYEYCIENGRFRQYHPDDGRCFKFPPSAFGNEKREIQYIYGRFHRISLADGLLWSQSKKLERAGTIHMIKQLMKETGLDAETLLMKKEYKDMIEKKYKFGRVKAFLQDNMEFLQ